MHGGRLDWNVANHSELIAYYQNFIQEHPTITRAYLYLLDNLIDDGRLDEAAKVLERRRTVIQDCFNDFYRLLIHESSNGFQATRKEYDMYLEENHEWQAYFLVAGRYASHGEYEKAITLFEKSFELQPKPRYIDHLESIAQLYLRMYKKNEAIHAYKRELQLLKEEWHQDDSADVQRVKALLTKCN